MKLECCAVVIIVLFLAGCFLRKGRKSYALCSLFMTILPIFHIGADFLGKHFLVKYSNSAPHYTFLIVDITAAVITSVLILVFSSNIKRFKNRVIYNIACISYTIIMTTILIVAG